MFAADLGLDAQTRYGLKRNADDGDLGRSGVAAAFGVAKGGAGVTPAGSGDAQIVFRVVDVAQPIDAGADAVPEDQRRAFAGNISDDLLDQLVARLQTVYPVTVSQSAIDQALSF